FKSGSVFRYSATAGRASGATSIQGSSASSCAPRIPSPNFACKRSKRFDPAISVDAVSGSSSGYLRNVESLGLLVPDRVPVGWLVGRASPGRAHRTLEAQHGLGVGTLVRAALLAL